MTFDRSNGRARRELSHVLKVFLIDVVEHGWRVKETRAVNLADIARPVETLLMEEGFQPSQVLKFFP